VAVPTPIAASVNTNRTANLERFTALVSSLANEVDDSDELFGPFEQLGVVVDATDDSIS